jgi:peptidoglycan/xylan/chitin deacetylase (PgdA/CDA1 family)
MTNHQKPAAVVHVDLDGASAIYTMHGWPYPHDTDPLFESGLENLLSMLERLDIRATLFVIAADLDNPRKLALLKKAVARGHEIGCHSWTHRRLTRLVHEERLHEISASREHIASQLDVPVNGFRAPYFDINGDTHRLIAEAGYQYDSSLFAGRKIASGNGHIQSGAQPARLWPEHAMVELPLPAYAPMPFPFHASYSLVLGNWYFRLGLARHRRNGAPLVLLFHLTDLADPLPAAMRRNWKNTFFTLSHMKGAEKQLCCERMLESVARHYRLTDTSTLLSEITPGA